MAVHGPGSPPHPLTLLRLQGEAGPRVRREAGPVVWRQCLGSRRPGIHEH